jgi:mxaJ protein
MPRASARAVAVAVTLATVVDVTARRRRRTQVRVLRVCADPDNLPFSNERREGFENRIADLIAADLHATVEYRWMPQRRGFVRMTLKARECDLVMGVPSEHDPVLATRPYTGPRMCSSRRRAGTFSYVLSTTRLRGLKIGIHASAEDGYNQPPAHALARRGIVGTSSVSRCSTTSP